MAYIEFNHIVKAYGSGEASIRALDDASFSVEKGELAVILGSSGAGKTTALNILGGMDVPTSGQILVDGNDITKYSKKQLIGYRRTDIGFVFQFYNLVPNLTALENVELAAQVCKDSLNASEMLDNGRADRPKGQFSGAAVRRGAAARIYRKGDRQESQDTSVRRADGALDYNTGKQILQLLQDTCRKDKITVLIITHNSALAPMADRLIRFKSGKVTEMKINENPTPIAEIEW